MLVALMMLSGVSQAQWFGDYNHRKSLALNAGVSAGTGYQIQVKVGESSGAAGFNLHVENKALNFPNDIRFTDNDGTTALGHWLESTTGTAPNRTATFWVKVNDSLDSSQSIFVYYRKSGDSSGSNGGNTFDFFDDFSAGPIDGAKWITDNATGWSVTGGELNGTNTSGRIRSQSTFSVGTVLETKYRSVTRPSNGNMALGFWNSTSDSFGWLNHPGGDYMRINSGWTGIGNEYKDNIPVIARITAKTTTQVDFFVYRLDTGATWHNRTDNNSNISNERIALGYRYDNTLSGQTYNAFWDWVRVRKYASSVPTLGAVGSEQVNAPSITLTSPTNGFQVVSGAAATATATVSAGTPPYSVQFHLNSSPVGAPVTSSPYTLNLGVLADGNYTIYATVTDSTSPTPVSANSATHNFTVAPDVTAPSPNPMTFSIPPVANGETSIRMKATTATDFASPAVQYYFENTTNSTNSGWVSSPTWTQGGLSLGQSYDYRVKARDSATPPNETAFSGISSATPGALPAYPVPINNFGFESPAIGDGQSTTGILGWTTIGDAGSITVWNPTSSYYASGVPEGQNIGDVFRSPAYSGFSQVLAGAEGQFQANTTYDLKVKVGRNLLDSLYDGYIIQLVVNGVVIAQDDNSRVPTAGTFVNASLKYSYNASLHSGLVGYPIEIRLLSKGLGLGFGDVNFDDVKLTYSTSNPIAIHGGPYRLSQGSSLSLNGSASIPSPGATITSYEWDLDSRNDHLGFIADASGATPSAIPYATLTGTYGLQPGVNTIRMRITDDSGESVTASTTLTIFTVYTYQGPDNPRGQDENWNKTANWNVGAIPSGLVDVIIPASKFVPCLSSTTPKYSGNLSIGTNSQLSVGWTTSGVDTYNCMGTPGQTVISMASGSSLNFRIGGTPLIPAITLNGDASATLGSSTQTGAQARFNYPITGAYRLSFYGNSTTNCVARLNAPNSFNEIFTAGQPYADGGVRIEANAPGSLGTGNLTFNALGGGGNSCLLVVNAPNSIADTATLSMSGNTALKITMNANDTIAQLVINGAQMPAGTYGGPSSAATFKQTWMSGTGILTVTEGVASIWDINGVTAGAGGATPSGTWDSSLANWSASTAGTGGTASWVAGRTAVFAAGTDATGSYNVTVGGSNAITATNTFTGWNNTGSSNFSVTRSWDLMQGNAVVVLISSLNATNINTATYNGLAMTVVPGAFDSRNSYVGIAYIIAGVNGAPDPLPSTGNVVLGVNRVVPSINTGSYANMGTVYSIMSLSNVASAGTAVTRVQSSGNANMSFTTSVNNSYVVGIASDSDWRKSVKSVVGTCNQVLFNSNTAQPAYFNTLQCRGPVGAAGSYTDAYSASLTALITMPFNAKTTTNPLLSGEGQKIAGLTFEEGAVTLSGNKLELQNNSNFTSSPGITGTVSSQITGLSTAGIVKKGAGTVVLSNNTNNYAGTTTIQNGTLRLGASSALPNTAVILSSDAAGLTPVLDLNGFNNTVAGLTFGGPSATSGSSIITGAGTLTLGGNVSYLSLNDPLGGTLAGNLSLGSSTRTFYIEDSVTAGNDLAVSAVISGSGGLTKTGFGTLLLSGNNSYAGLTTVSNGLLVLSGSDNSAATGGITVNANAAIRFDALGAINGTGQNVTIGSGGLAYFGPSFGAGNIPAALNRFNPASTGVIAVDNYGSTAFDLDSNGLNVYVGALNDTVYSGLLTPNGGTYRIGGGSGTITLGGVNALTGSGTLLINGSVIIANSNSFNGDTEITTLGRLQLGAGGTTGSIESPTLTNNGTLAFNRSDTLTQGVDFWSSIESTLFGKGIVEKLGSGTLVLNEANYYEGGTNLLAGTLVLENEEAIGFGPLSIYSGTLDVSAPLTLFTDNEVTVVGDFSFGGTADLNMGYGDLNIFGNTVITLGGTDSSLTFEGIMTNISGEDQILTVDGEDNTLVLGGLNMSGNINSFLIDITIGGTGNVSITGPVNDWTGGDPEEIYDPNDTRLGTITKNGPGILTLSGDNNYSGNTVVNAGVLHLAAGEQISPIIVNSGAILAFTLESIINSSERLTLNEGHKIRIVGTPTLPSYTLMSASSISGGVPTLETPIFGYFLEIAGNELRLTQEDLTPPELVDITNDQGVGTNVGPIVPNTLVTYTITFNEDILDGSFTAADLDNSGTSTITFGTIMEISPGVFTVEVTPTTAGTLILRIPGSAVIEDAFNNELVVPLVDDTTITVALPPTDWLASSDIVDDVLGGPVSPGTLVTYTLYFSQDINHATVTAADFVNTGTSAITIGTITEIEPGTFTVQVTPTTVGTLKLTIPTDADIRDPSNSILDVDPAIVDDTTINVVEPYAIWATGGATFSGDANADGIQNGLAWLLGASDPSENARFLLPTATTVSGELRLSFITLDSDSRGSASMKVQYSNDMGVSDPWTSHEAEVPDTSSTVNGIVFMITPLVDGYIGVEARIPATAAGTGKKLFSRVNATE